MSKKLPIIYDIPSGETSSFTIDEQMSPATVGLHIDKDRNRLLAAGHTNLTIWDLNTNKLLHNIDLTKGTPNQKKHLANDVVNDAEGNIYITDSLAKVIYKVDTKMHPSLFYKGPLLAWPNGIEILNNKYLIVSDYNSKDGKLSLVKIPLNNPKKTSLIPVKGSEYRGFDGMVMTESGELVGITQPKKGKNSLLMKLASDDGWKTAHIVSYTPTNRSTTVAQYKADKYLVLNQDFQHPNALKWSVEKVTLR